jgi:hypothetical protein
MEHAACRACPGTDIKRKGVEDMTTVKAPLRGGVELVNLDKRASIPRGFMLQLAHELTPTSLIALARR